MSGPTFTAQQLEAATKAIFANAVTTYSHDLALSALLGAYATIAVSHPCCMETSARCTAVLAIHLQGLVDKQGAPVPGQHPPGVGIH